MAKVRTPTRVMTEKEHKEGLEKREIAQFNLVIVGRKVYSTRTFVVPVLLFSLLYNVSKFFELKVAYIPLDVAQEEVRGEKNFFAYFHVSSNPTQSITRSLESHTKKILFYVHVSGELNRLRRLRLVQLLRRLRSETGAHRPEAEPTLHPGLHSL